MKDILQSWSHTIRFLVALLFLFILLRLILGFFFSRGDFNINFTNDKTLVTFIDKKYVIANSVLPACDTWINTGVEIRPDETFEIKVSGKIHTAADKIIEDATMDMKPRYCWIGPEGSPFIIGDDPKTKLSNTIRQNLLLKSDANIGSVLFYLQKENSPDPNCDISKKLFLPDAVSVYDKIKGFKGTNSDNTTYFLWATINDILLRDLTSDSSHIAYIGGETDPERIKMKEMNWKAIQKENYNRHWFDDNIGQFIISIKIIRATPFDGLF